MREDSILKAICDDDRPEVKRLLSSDGALATLGVSKARLYQAGIFHWLYAADTPLHLAAAGYRVEIARLFLAAGAEPNARRNMRHSTPLHYAADGCQIANGWNPKRQVEMIRCLLEAGAEIDAPDKNGATPLHRAVRTRCAAAVQHLLEAGCDITIRNKPGSTAFHLAVQNTGRGGSGSEIAINEQRQIIQEFLARGVSVKLKDGKGKSVLDCAKSGWIREMLEA